MSTAQFCPVGKLEKLLLAIDGSLHSEGAIREAINFAAKCSSRLYVCMVLETNPEYETIGSNVFEKEVEEARTHLEAVKTRAAKEGVSCELLFHQSMEAAEVIVNEAADKQVDMIVIGRHGRKGLLKAFMGELAEKVLIHAPCKVLVVPKAAQIAYKNILVATDGSGHSLAAVQEAITIAKRCGSRIIVLSSIRSEGERPHAQENVDKVLALAQEEGVEADGITPLGRSHELIVETAGGRGVDLIVMGMPVKTAVEKIFTGSATEKVIGKAGCAVMIAKGTGAPATV